MNASFRASSISKLPSFSGAPTLSKLLGRVQHHNRTQVLTAARCSPQRRTIIAAPVVYTAFKASRMAQATSLQRSKFSDSDQKYVILNSGVKMPLIGLGTALASNEQVEAAVKHALSKAGYKHIDTAANYENEVGVGKGLKVVPREEVFVTTKLANPDHGRVADAAREQLQRLGTDYVDLYLIHWPVTGHVKNGELDPPIQDTWREMEKLVDQGLCRSIGVSNFSVKKLKDLQSYARIQPAVNQVETHVWHRNSAIVEHCKATGVQVQAYRCNFNYFRRGLMENCSPMGGLPMWKGARPSEDPEVLRIAQKHDKSPNQVLVRWNIEWGTCPVPKSTRPERIDENIGVWNWKLDQSDFDALSNLTTQVRMCDGKGFLQSSPYSSLDDLWDGEP